jgi:hypothetical protein
MSVSIAHAGDVWTAPNGRRIVVTQRDEGKGEVELAGSNNWIADDLGSQGYTLYLRPASNTDLAAALARIATLETQLATTNAMAMAAITRLNAAGIS